MATTIPASFQRLKENIEITGLQKTTVATRQQNVRAAVEREMTVLDSFLTGSYARSTLISPLNEADVDIFVVLSASYFQNFTPGTLLDKVKSVLLKTYLTSPRISRNGQAVTITFTDFQVDVVPAFYREGGGYLIPNSMTGGYISTNPKTHVDLMASENLSHDSDLVPLVKMIKAWNKNIGQGFVSFYLELMAINALKGIKISDFASGVRFLFDKGRETKGTVPSGDRARGAKDKEGVPIQVGLSEWPSKIEAPLLQPNTREILLTDCRMNGWSARR